MLRAYGYYARLGPEGYFDEVEVEDWVAKLNDVRGFDDAQLSTSRHHT
jgi:hypothetical protein